MKNFNKKALSVVLVVVMLLSVCNSLIFTTSAVEQNGPIITASKTAKWTNTAKTTAEIDITVKSDDLNSKTKEVLLLGTLCKSHGMGSGTLLTTINTIAKKMNVQYYAISADEQDYSSSDIKSGYLKKNETTSSITTGNGQHFAAKAFIDTLYNELITQKKTYDFLFFEFDSSRIATFIEEDLSTTQKNDLVAKADELAPVLSKYYTDHKVVWVTDSNRAYSYAKVAPNNKTENYTSSPAFYLEKLDFKILTCIVSPTEYAGFDTKFADYNTNTQYFLKDIDSYESDVSYESKISYEDVIKLNDFIKKRLLSQRNDVVIKDTVVDDMEITGTKVQTSADGTTWSNYTVSSPSSVVVSEDKKSVTATIKDIVFEIGTIQYVRLVIDVKDTGRFKVSTDKSVTSRDPNKGAADVSVTPLGYTKTETKPTTEKPLDWSDQNIYNLKTIVRGGTTPNADFYAAKGESPISETSPSKTAYELVYVKINNVALTGTDKTNYNSTHKYTATNIAKDTTVRVCYGTKVKGTYPPVKTNETTPEKKSDDMYTNTDIKVVLNDGKWTKPANLTATSDKEVYTIAGDYDMGNATKDGYVFLGWKVEDDTNEADDIVKIYTAIFEEDKIGDIVTDPTKDQKDGIPDKYQKLITFKVVNGTWDGTANNNKDKKQYITLKDNSGNWSVDGSATVTAPSGMTADYGYEKGTWGTTSKPTVTSGSNLTLTKSTDTTFTHSFSKIGDKKVKFKKPNSTNPGSTDIPYGKNIQINPNGGSVTVSSTKYTTTFTKKIEADFNIPDATAPTGYDFIGWEETAGSGDIVKVYKAQYKAQTVESKYQPEQKGDKKPDKITDKTSVKYDDKVKVVLNGGTWKDAPTTLVATTTSGVYTVKGNYDVGYAEKKDNVFLGWKVEDGKDGIVKVYTAIFKEDKVGNGPEPDGTPDEYQRLVTFKIVNGTWNGTAGNNADKTQYITLKDNSGNWSVDGSANVAVPSGMVENTGYENGAWDASNPTATSGASITLNKSSDFTFTYKYTLSNKEIKYKVPDEEQPKTTELPYGKKIKIDPNGGSVTVDSTEHKTAFEKTIEEDFEIPDAIPMTGYEFTGWKAVSLTGSTDLLVVYTAQYKAKAVENKYQPEQKDDEKPEEVTDNSVKFDEKVKVILNGGTWVNAPEELVKTGEKDTYVVKGDYNMSYATLEGYEFLGWEVIDGEDGVAKVYTAKYKVISPVTSDDFSSVSIIVLSILAACSLLGALLMLRKNKLLSK